MGDVHELGEALAIIEGLIIGDLSRGIPAPAPALGIGLGIDPTLPISLGTGGILGRPLNEADFLTDKEVVIVVGDTVGSRASRERTYDLVDDTFETWLSTLLPITDNAADQRVARNEAFTLDTRIRGKVMTFDALESLGLQVYYVRTRRRLALNTGTGGSAGYGSAQYLVQESIYRMRRVESLIGGIA